MHSSSERLWFGGRFPAIKYWPPLLLLHFIPPPLRWIASSPARSPLLTSSYRWCLPTVLATPSGYHPTGSMAWRLAAAATTPLAPGGPYSSPDPTASTTTDIRCACVSSTDLLHPCLTVIMLYPRKVSRFSSMLKIYFLFIRPVILFWNLIFLVEWYIFPFKKGGFLQLARVVLMLISTFSNDFVFVYLSSSNWNSGDWARALFGTMITNLQDILLGIFYLFGLLY